MTEPRRIEFTLIDRAQKHLDRAVEDAGRALTFEGAMDALLSRQLAAKADMSALSAHLRTRDALIKAVVSG